MFPYYVLIPVVCAFMCMAAGIFFYRSLPVPVRILILEALVSFMIDITSYLLPERINHLIHNVFLFIDFLLIIYVVYCDLPQKMRKSLYVASCAVLAVVLVLSLFKFGIYHFANWAYVTSSLLLVMIYFMALYYNEHKPAGPQKVPIRIICIAIILYHVGTFPLFSQINYIFVAYWISDVIIDINTILDSVKYLLIAYGFYRFKVDAAKTYPVHGG